MKYLFILTIFITSFLSVNLGSAEAVSWQNTLTRCDWNGCHTDPYFNVTVNSDKSTYLPGETIQLSSSMQALICNNSAAIYSLSATVPGDSTNLSNLNIVSGGNTHYSSGSLIAPNTPGQHEVELTSCHFGWGTQCTIASFSITVTGSVPVPTPVPTPTPVPAAIISGTTCKIASGASNCLGILSWFISGASNPNVYNNNGTTYSSNYEGIDQPVHFDYGLNTIYARNGNDIHATTNISTQCDVGLVWANGVCGVYSAPVNPPPSPVITITITKDIIRSGETTDTKTIVTAPYPTRCTLYGVSSSPIVFTHLGSASSPTHPYDYTTRPLTSAQMVKVICEPEPLIPGVPSASADKRINVIPTVQET